MTKQQQRMTAIWVAAIVAVGLLAWRPWEKEIDEPYVVAILAETGGADFIGKPEAQWLRHYDSILRDGTPFKLKIENTGTDADSAVRLLKTHAANPNCLAVIGPSTSGESVKVVEANSKLSDPLVILSLAASRRVVEDPVTGRQRQWVFKFAQNDTLAAERLVATMQGQGQRQVALLWSRDPFGKSGAEEFRKAAEAGSIPILHDAGFDKGLDSAMAPIKALSVALADGAASPPPAVVIWGTAGVAKLVKELKRQGLTNQVYLSHGSASDTFIRSAGVAAEGVILVGSHVLKGDAHLKSDSGRDRVLKEYRAMWSKPPFSGVPSHFAGHARDAYMALSTALRSLQAPVKRMELRAALETLEPMTGVTGTFRFSATDHAGLTLESFETYRIVAGAFEPLSSK